MYEMWQMNHLWLTQIYLYRWYIPDLIRLATDIATNPGPAVVDNTKLFALLIQSLILLENSVAHSF